VSDEEGTKPEPGVVMHLLPVYIREAFLVDSMIVSLLPWGAPGFSGFRGHYEAMPDQSVALINYEWPVPEIPVTMPLATSELEDIHLRRIQTDHLLATGELAYARVVRGEDPPDYRAVSGGTEIGLELSQLSLESRRGALALFERIRRSVGAAGRDGFSRLSGCLVYMWFGDEQDPVGLPHRAADSEAIEAVVDALAEYSPDPGRMLVEPGPLPERAPDPQVSTTAFAATFYAVPMANAVPMSPFFEANGFELALGFATDHSSASGWLELGRVVAKHDQAGVDHLLITVGAPDSLGRSSLAETVQLDLMLTDPMPLQGVRNLQRVSLHRWDTGRILDVWPTLAERSGPIFQGAVVAHRLAAVPGEDLPAQ
jgi:hypothetical protein